MYKRTNRPSLAYMISHEGDYMLTKVSLNVPLGVLTVRETLSRLVKLESSDLTKDSGHKSSFLTVSEVQSLREEMVRDGALMKEWLAARER